MTWRVLVFFLAWGPTAVRACSFVSGVGFSMDPSDPQQLASLATLFQQTLNPSQRKAAEEQLAQLQVQPRFSFLLLALIQLDTASNAIRLAAAIRE